MSYKIKILSQDEHVEESLWIEVDGKILNVFCSDYNFVFNVNSVYHVELEYEIFDEYVPEITDNSPQFRKIDQSFAYEIIGMLNNETLSVGDIFFKDEILLSEYGYLDNKIISLKVDRIKLYFD
ncbi:hypothetical protein [Acinetobacter sp. ANC 3813]|uniref:hypothetical protein n=1 Tax=Acinetobacter sp. ANC 3813 TaxID=1977873 RepID=UPI000A347D26|nr:hypothetical protein [Acinetobacter sp. ANC 3813]OTG91458.1 hypothetical protein B9T34_03895 [Acinetobacter sp. ANC 3813]